MTHAELVIRARAWLQRQRCAVILAEVSSMSNREIPDAIGWKYESSNSYMIECKASRQDFRKDAKKRFRKEGFPYAMGKYRYYLTPPGLLKVSELPPRWGLLEARPKTIKTIRRAQPHPSSHYSAYKEMNVMIAELSMIQRLCKRRELIPSGHVQAILRGMQQALKDKDRYFLDQGEEI